jgi:choice-of-anchor C domain-containing protein
MKKRLLASLLLAGTTSLSIAGSALAFTGVSNGSFETGTFSTNPYDTLTTGSTAMADWTVVSGSIDWIGDYWPGSDPASPPSRSLDLNGLEPGAISQAFDTTLGNTYHVTFDLSGNPDCGSPAKTLTVNATGGSTDTYSFDVGSVGNTRSDMMWAPQTYSFVATGPQSTLTFTSTTTGTACGPALDNVAVTETVAETPQPTAKSDCMDGGWQTLADVDGNGFKNQGDCVSYVATGGKNPGSVMAVLAAEKHASKAHTDSTKVTTTASASHHEKTNHGKATTHASKHGHKSGH